MRLTAKKIARMKEPGRYRDDDVRGLYLQLRARKGTKKLTGSWVLRYERNGVEKMMGLGPWPEVELSRAREDARELRYSIRKGIDPLASRKAEQQKRSLETTFREVALAHIQRQQVGWKNPKHIAQWSSTLSTWVYPVIGSLPVKEVDTAAVMKVLTQEPKDHPGKTLWEALPETAGRVRGRVERILDAAKAMGARTGENPAAWRGHLDQLLPNPKALKSVRNHPALPFDELPGFMLKLDKHEGVAPRALAFAVLTSSRTREVTEARWDEIDFAKKTWTVPASRMKMKRPHRVPLSDRALAILKSVPHFDGNPYVFVSPTDEGKPLSSGALTAALKRSGTYRDKNGDSITVHGFRSTFKDWARERTNFATEISEAALAHIVGDKTERAYARGDLFEKRRALMMAWEKFATTPPSKTAKVVPMRRAAK